MDNGVKKAQTNAPNKIMRWMGAAIAAALIAATATGSNTSTWKYVTIS